MSSTADADDVIEVSADGLTVRKRFAADEFPVPAIRFEIESDHDEAVTFRLSEAIPESFSMDKVGFHPDYYSDDWTAFQDNHVEFTGTVGADESLVTVYGIRIDDESAVAEFLTEPTVVEVSSEDDAGSDADAIDDDIIETIVDDDGSQAVKDLIAGEADSVPGLEDEALDLDLEDGLEDEPDIELGFDEGEVPDADEDAIEAPAPEDAVDLELSDEESDENVDEADGLETDPAEIHLGLEDESDDDSVDDEPLDEGAKTTDDGESKTTDAESDDGSTEEEPGDADSDGADDEPAAEASPGDEVIGAESATADDAVGIDESDAEEETADGVDDSDETIDDADSEETAGRADESNETTETNEADSSSEPTAALEEPISARLATEIREGSVDEDDLDVLRAELDLGPSGSEIAKVEHLQSRVEEIAAYTDAIERFLDEEGTGEQLVEEFRTELSTFEDDLAAMDEAIEATDGRVDDVETDVESLTDWTADLETDLEGVSEDVETVDADLENVSDDLEAVDERVDEVEDDLEEVQEGLTDIQDWRDQLGSMFADN